MTSLLLLPFHHTSHIKHPGSFLIARSARRLSAKINLIPYNTVEGLECSRPSRARQEKFQSILRQHGVIATLRREKGHDIAAACGQLRLQTNRAERELRLSV